MRHRYSRINNFMRSLSRFVLMKRLVIFLQGGNFVSRESCLVTRIINKRLFFMARAGHELSEGAMLGKRRENTFFI